MREGEGEEKERGRGRENEKRGGERRGEGGE